MFFKSNSYWTLEICHNIHIEWILEYIWIIRNSKWFVVIRRLNILQYLQRISKIFCKCTRNGFQDKKGITFTLHWRHAWFKTGSFKINGFDIFYGKNKLCSSLHGMKTYIFDKVFVVNKSIHNYVSTIILSHSK